MSRFSDYFKDHGLSLSRNLVKLTRFEKISYSLRRTAPVTVLKHHSMAWEHIATNPIAGQRCLCYSLYWHSVLYSVNDDKLQIYSLVDTKALATLEPFSQLSGNLKKLSLLLGGNLPLIWKLFKPVVGIGVASEKFNLKRQPMIQKHRLCW